MPSNEARILVVQDRDDTLRFQIRNLKDAAASAGLPVTIDGFDLSEPPGALLADLEAGRRWYDWMVLDLLLDGIDPSAMSSAGLNLLRAVQSRGLFGGYGARRLPAFGIRCIAIYSAVVGEGGAMPADLASELGRLGIPREWSSRPSVFKSLATRIVEHLAHECRAQSS